MHLAAPLPNPPRGRANEQTLLIMQLPAALPNPSQREGHSKLANFRTLDAATTTRLNQIIKILFAVIVGDFFTRLNVSPGPDPNPAPLGNKGFGIRSARMIDVARSVRARTAVNRPPRINSKEIPAARLIHDLVGHQGTKIFDDAFAFRN